MWGVLGVVIVFINRRQGLQPLTGLWGEITGLGDAVYKFINVCRLNNFVQ